MVTNTNDSGEGSLREAINFANANPGADTISFNIPGAGPHTITVSSFLPSLTGTGDAIDGTTQPGASCGDLWAGVPHTLLIRLQGPSGGSGINLNGANQTVRGMSVTGFSNKIDTLANSSNTTIQCNYIGLLPDGTRGTGTTVGVVLRGAGARIGGLNPGEGNVISGNSQAVWTTTGSTDTAVRGNFIGTDPTGMIARSNTRGINNLSGTASWRDITYNLFAGNSLSDIILDPDDTITPSNGQILIQRNVIGYNRTQTAKLQVGTTAAIRFDAGSITNVLIGGDTTQGNVIGGLQSGIEIFNGSNITIQGNTIAGSGGRGIVLANVNGATIGGTSTGLANIIGGNGDAGIRLDGGSSNISILGNTIGTATIAGITAGNGWHGIKLENVSNITIGNGTAGGRNLIGGNGRRAIEASGTTSGITINFNHIGTDASGNVAVANGWNLVGTAADAISFGAGGNYSNTAILNNVIGGYSAALIEFWNSTATGITIQGNKLGVGADLSSPIVSGNVEELILINGTSPRPYSNILIGDPNGPEGIGANQLRNSAVSGIVISSTGSNIQVVGNTIRNNAGNGILLVAPTIASIYNNAIWSNGGLGIDLGSDGVTLNDPGDGDSGPNNLLNFPVFTALNAAAGGDLSYAFTLDAPANSNGYRIDFYRNSSADPTGYGEGETWLGFIDTPAHPGGSVAYSGTYTPLAAVSAGNIVSATSTRKTGASTYAETSEFNQNGTLVTPLVVTNANNAGAGSLRNAIDFANSDPAQDAITFNIPGSGVQTITLASALPALTDEGISIDGTTQPGAACGDLWAGTPHTLLIRLDGVNRSFLGITSAGANHLIKGLSLTNFADGVRGSATSSNAAVQCNYLGLAPDGTSAGNASGARTFGANTLIGGLTAGQGNVISANTIIGVSSGTTASAMAVRGNFVGTDPLGTAARPNAAFTISNERGTASWSDITRNLIAGNTGDGIDLQGDDAVNPSAGTITIAGNFIGVDRTGTAALPNIGSGIDFTLGTINNLTIGGTNAADRNLISGNGTHGIHIGPQSGAVILGNTIGLAADGATAIANTNNGIRLQGTTNAQIGNGTAAGRNIISGNNRPGIYITGGSSGITVLGNYVGTNSTGLAAVRNIDAGILIEQSSNITIGNGTAGGRNILSGNNLFGAEIRDGSSSISILGNYVGVGADGFTKVGNSRSAFNFDNITNVQVGDGTIGGRNILSGNGNAGSFDHGVFATSTTNLTFAGNYIGVAADGFTVLGNARNGLMFQSLPGQTGHANTVITGNVISGNGAGVDISSFSATNLGAPATITFTGNLIGVAADGVTPAGNLGYGIKNTNVPGQITIGGSAPSDANIIAHNGQQGVTVTSLPLTVAVIGNSIHSNGGIGIDLGRDGVTANDAGDGDTGSNDLLNNPVLNLVNIAGGNQLGYDFNLDVPAHPQGYRIEFFKNVLPDDEEGQIPLGSINIAHAGGNLNFAGLFTAGTTIAQGDRITATTSRINGSGFDITSEFSIKRSVVARGSLGTTISGSVIDVTGLGAFNIPGNDQLINVNVTNATGLPSDNIEIILSVPGNAEFFFGDIDGPGPETNAVIFDGTNAPGLALSYPADVRFSNAATAPLYADCSYTPVPGYDPSVSFICIKPQGTMPGGDPNPSFDIRFRQRVP